MLVLSRDVGQGILIGDDIRVMVVKNNGHVRIGIDAPRELLILREELAGTPREDRASCDSPATDGGALIELADGSAATDATTTKKPNQQPS